jgi:hypothetical protein
LLMMLGGAVPDPACLGPSVGPPVESSEAESLAASEEEEDDEVASPSSISAARRLARRRVLQRLQLAGLNSCAALSACLQAAAPRILAEFPPVSSPSLQAVIPLRC